ncbi:MAG TPA: AAA family ATPase [Candidatus Dormibacteraeota bacterium]|nr:AAA family ATPase [Candidatus Dormibacteraeota bacterium]HVC22930.1 AAA family ATPase [Candidatus Dormibacteraeota bacterium]
MRERVTSIEVTAFRGVPGSLQLDFARGRSTMLFGENGTGKSTIADALEWYFTGRLDFLSHEGRKHAIRNLGAKGSLTTKVVIVTDGRLGGEVQHPDSPPQAAIEAGQNTPFLLRGRTLADFVDKRKAEKWKYLSDLLGLRAVDQLRLDLQTAMNDLKKALMATQQELRQRESMLTQFEVAPTEVDVLKAIRTRCAAVDFPTPETFQAAVSPTWAKQMYPGSESSETAHRVAAVRASLPALQATPNRAPIDRWNAALDTSDASSQLRLSLYSTAQEYVESISPTDTCPLCGQGIKSDELADRIRLVIGGLADAAKRIQSAQEPAAMTFEVLKQMAGAARAAVSQAAGLSIVLEAPPSGTPIEEAEERLRRHSQIAWPPLSAYIQELEVWTAGAILILDAAAPVPASERDRSILDLGLLISAAREWTRARSEETRAKAAADIATAVFTEYQEAQAKHLERILERISSRVGYLYTKLHPNERLSEAKIVRSADKGLELSINFHGTDQSPPHGVLSESHLNSLAIALFLAMAEAFNSELGFIVLDDVVNSFDADHRGQLAQVLVEDFANRQLLVFTHDALFYDRIRRYSSGWGFLELTSWSYAEGPRLALYETSALLAKAEASLSDDRIGAAQKGRRALEELLQEVCEGLGGRVAFRRGVKNDRREIGELIPAVRSLLKSGDSAAYKVTGELLTGIEADVATVFNVEAHASATSASGAEISTALRRVSALEGVWTCSSCNTRVWHSGSSDSWQCRCGAHGFPGRLDIGIFTDTL